MSRNYLTLAICLGVAQILCVAGLSADVEAYLKHKSEKHLAPSVGPINPKEITLIGTVNGKTFFMERTVTRTQIQGRSYCNSLGMTAARFENQVELDFVNDNIPTSDDYLWTDGEAALTPRSFQWNESGTGIDPNLILEDGQHIGLTLSKYSSHGELASSLSDGNHAIICYL